MVWSSCVRLIQYVNAEAPGVTVESSRSAVRN